MTLQQHWSNTFFTSVLLLLESRASISFSIVLNYGQIEDLNSSTPLCNACVNV